MIPWGDRSNEQRALLNPSFTSILIWHAARGHVSVSELGLPLEESFLVMPIVLHRATRESLPRNLRTSLAVWLERDPLVRGRVSGRARALVPYTKEALLFGGMYGAFVIDSGRILPCRHFVTPVRRELGDVSSEVKECVKKAEHVGKWFAATGNPSTVMALIGVRP